MMKASRSDLLSYISRENRFHADMAELADAPDLGSGAARRAGSIPVIRTKQRHVSRGTVLYDTLFDKAVLPKSVS